MQPMSVSTRTPAGLFGRCPVCGAEFMAQSSDPLLDAPCPGCGTLLWPLCRGPEGGESAVYFLLANELTPATRRQLSDALARLDAGSMDSLDKVEALMELEDLFETRVPDEVAAEWRSADDAIAWIQANHQGRS